MAFMPSAKSDARWRDAIVLTVALWAFAMLAALPYVIARYPSGDWVSLALDISTVFVSISLALLLFACFRATVGWPDPVRVLTMGSAVVVVALAQMAFDVLYSALVASNVGEFFAHWRTDFKEVYQRGFRYFLVYAGNVALFQLAFVHRRSLTSERQLTDARAAAQHAQLEALRYQLNPHFLFNTLNSISSLIVTRRNEDAEQMTNKLSSFLRASLTCNPAGLVPLEEELALTEEYLDIEGVRFGKRLNVEIECASDAGNALVPGFLVQPLVENAIKHGVAPSREPVTIRIEAEIVDGQLCISIENDALPEGEKLVVGGTGVGLMNVRRRLQAVFGEAASLTTERTGKTYVATICIPGVQARC